MSSIRRTLTKLPPRRLPPLLFVALLPAAIFAAGGDEAGDGPYVDLTELSLDDLMNIEVTSVSKREQKLADSAAAVFVITQDEIRRSGAHTAVSLRPTSIWPNGGPG